MACLCRVSESGWERLSPGSQETRFHYPWSIQARFSPNWPHLWLAQHQRFMLNGVSVFHSMRAEIYPRDCAKPVGNAGLTRATTVTVGDSSLIASGMSVYGTGVAHGAKVTGVSGTTISLTLANTGNVSGDLVFGGTVSPTTTATGNVSENTIVVSNPSGIESE